MLSAHEMNEREINEREINEYVYQINGNVSDMDRYLIFLLEKMYIFDKRADKDDCNCICDIDKLREVIDISKKLTDIEYLLITKKILSEFDCYDIFDFTFSNKLTECDILFKQFKMYKQTVREIEKGNLEKEQKKSTKKVKDSKFDCIKRDDNIDTSDMWYIDSLDSIITQQLMSKFGELKITGKEDDKYRYEFKLVFNYENNNYKYSIYDYVNSNYEFYNEEDIFWHVSSNCEDKSINKKFIKLLTKICVN